MSCLPGAQLSKAPQEHELGVGNGPASPSPSVSPVHLSPRVSLDVSLGVGGLETLGMVR